MSQTADRLITKEGDGTPGAKQTHMYTQTHSWNCSALCGMHTSSCTYKANRQKEQLEQKPELIHSHNYHS